MLSIATKGVKAAVKAIEDDAKQMRFAGAVALTRTAKIAADEEKKEAKRDLDNPTPFTLRGFRYEKATKANLQARVFVMPDQAKYLYFQVEGGKRLKRAKSGEALPVIGNIRINRYGNIVGRGAGALKKLIDRPDVFIGRAGRNRGVWGIWQRIYENIHLSGQLRGQKTGKTMAAGSSRKRNAESSRLKLIARLEPSVKYKSKFSFYETAAQVFNKRFEREFETAIDYARRTAK